MFEEVLITLMSFVVSESDAFPSVEQMREIPKAQQLVINENSLEKTQERHVPVVREFMKKLLLKNKNAYAQNAEQLARLVDRMRTT